jgi:hypothetical protein
MRTLEKRCEMRIAVLPALSSLKRRNTSYSERASSAAVGSSRISTSASRIDARDRDLLPFAAGEFDAIPKALADHLLITSGKLGDHLIRLAARRRPLDARAVLPRFDPSHRDVVGGAEIVADEILEDDAHVSAQRTEIVLAQIVAILMQLVV